MSGHRHTNGPEHDHEPQLGLPERLPASERLLWQGSPDWRPLAVRVFHVRKLAVYFTLILLLRGAFAVADGASASAALRSVLVLLPLPLLAIGLAVLLAWLSARATVYTITDRRVVMRIGIVLTVTFNLPLKCLTGAGLRLDGHGHGDLPLALAPGNRIAWLQLWPHVRPWRLQQPEPMLRCVPDAAEVARTLTQAWSSATGLAATAAGAPAAPSPVPSPAAAPHGGAQPALAGR